MTAVPASATALQTRQAPWWLGLMSGILNIILAILLLTSPVQTTIALVWVLGLYWVIQGIFTLVGMFVDHTGWGWKLLSGVLGIVVGTIVLRHPIVSAAVIPATLVLILGIQGIIVGIISLVMAFKGGGWGAGILGVLSIIFGGVLVMNFAKIGTIAAFIWVVGIFWLIGGILMIVNAFRNRS